MRHTHRSSPRPPTQWSASRTTGMLGPGADEAFAPLTAPEIKPRVQLAHWVTGFRTQMQHHIARPVGRMLLRRWMSEKPASRSIESRGLPRHIVEEVLGGEALTVHVDPRKLIRMAVCASTDVKKRPSSMAFIWDGDWDLRREDLRVGTRYRFISDIDRHRDCLEKTARYQDLLACIERGEPWSSHQLGLRLDTSEKILDFLRVYLDFLDEMATNGFDASRGKDPIGVAVSRSGTLLKVNRGLHRLAMAQLIGLESIPVRVRHVHRLWWDEVTEGLTGAEALEKMAHALQDCLPEENPGALDESAGIVFTKNFWPPRRVPMAS